eukprot:Sspe_Gene.74279::Locus_45890_Transcript_1_1_Confidence_1.000_Length_1987::g.74279::m.74279
MTRGAEMVGFSEEFIPFGKGDDDDAMEPAVVEIPRRRRSRSQSRRQSVASVMSVLPEGIVKRRSQAEVVMEQRVRKQSLGFVFTAKDLGRALVNIANNKLAVASDVVQVWAGYGDGTDPEFYKLRERLKFYDARDIGVVTTVVHKMLFAVMRGTRWFALRVKRLLQSTKVIQTWWRLSLRRRTQRICALLADWCEYEAIYDKLQHLFKKKYLRATSVLNITDQSDFARDYFRKWIPESVKRKVIDRFYRARVQLFHAAFTEYHKARLEGRRQRRLRRLSLIPLEEFRRNIAPLPDWLTPPPFAWYSDLRALPADSFIRAAYEMEIEHSAKAVAEKGQMGSTGTHLNDLLITFISRSPSALPGEHTASSDGSTKPLRPQDLPLTEAPDASVYSFQDFIKWYERFNSREVVSRIAELRGNSSVPDLGKRCSLASSSSRTLLVTERRRKSVPASNLPSILEPEGRPVKGTSSRRSSRASSPAPDQQTSPLFCQPLSSALSTSSSRHSAKSSPLSGRTRKDSTEAFIAEMPTLAQIAGLVPSSGLSPSPSPTKVSPVRRKFDRISLGIFNAKNPSLQLPSPKR